MIESCDAEIAAASSVTHVEVGDGLASSNALAVAQGRTTKSWELSPAGETSVRLKDHAIGCQTVWDRGSDDGLEGLMASGEWAFCMHCGNKKEGARIYKCHHCGYLFCEACKPLKCPKCGGEQYLFGSWSKVGVITR